jgi:hypothetical protein
VDYCTSLCSSLLSLLHALHPTTAHATRPRQTWLVFQRHAVARKYTTAHPSRVAARSPAAATVAAPPAEFAPPVLTWPHPPRIQDRSSAIETPSSTASQGSHLAHTSLCRTHSLAHILSHTPPSPPPALTPRCAPRALPYPTLPATVFAVYFQTVAHFDTLTASLSSCRVKDTPSYFGRP